jgi:phosphatidylserine/phosphatidylglycerophosphate/cardiolipin synthase-like enzyme
LGGTNHPTRRLLELLVRKAAAGCRVRVLLDRDDQGDPYGSNVVNEPAARYLSRGGVQVRFDRPDMLLHSKFVVVDDDTAVVGSHNWTTGSFLTYRDLSIALRGGDAVALWKHRFEALWAESEPFDPS